MNDPFVQILHDHGLYKRLIICMTLFQRQFHKNYNKKNSIDSRLPRIIGEGFFWKDYPPCEQIMYESMGRYYDLSSPQQQLAFNNHLVKRVRKTARQHGHKFSSEHYDNDNKLRDRCRRFFKDQLEKSRRRLKTLQKYQTVEGKATLRALICKTNKSTTTTTTMSMDTSPNSTNAIIWAKKRRAAAASSSSPPKKRKRTASFSSSSSSATKKNKNMKNKYVGGSQIRHHLPLKSSIAVKENNIPKVSTTTAASNLINRRGNGSLEVFRGKPTEQLGVEYTCGSNNDNVYWPDGWTKLLTQRKKGRGNSKSDPHWITPKMKYKLRSMVEVKQFLIALQLYNGNEGIAYQKSIRIKRQKNKRTNKRNQNNYFQQQDKDKVLSVCNWVQCENGDCQKWRKIPLSLNNVDIDIDILLSGKKFICSDINSWTTTATATITTGIRNVNSEPISCNTPEDDSSDTEIKNTTE